jgi:hypothetical protein
VPLICRRHFYRDFRSAVILGADREAAGGPDPE